MSTPHRDRGQRAQIDAAHKSPTSHDKNFRLGEIQPKTIFASIASNNPNIMGVSVNPGNDLRRRTAKVYLRIIGEYHMLDRSDISKGSKTEPWGTPVAVVSQPEHPPALLTTACDRPVKYEKNQRKADSPKPKLRSFTSNLEWEMLSKALPKFNRTSNVTQPSSTARRTSWHTQHSRLRTKPTPVPSLTGIEYIIIRNEISKLLMNYSFEDYGYFT